MDEGKLLALVVGGIILIGAPASVFAFFSLFSDAIVELIGG